MKYTNTAYVPVDGFDEGQKGSNICSVLGSKSFVELNDGPEANQDILLILDDQEFEHEL